MEKQMIYPGGSKFGKDYVPILSIYEYLTLGKKCTVETSDPELAKLKFKKITGLEISLTPIKDKIDFYDAKLITKTR